LSRNSYSTVPDHLGSQTVKAEYASGDVFRRRSTKSRVGLNRWELDDPGGAVVGRLTSSWIGRDTLELRDETSYRMRLSSFRHTMSLIDPASSETVLTTRFSGGFATRAGEPIVWRDRNLRYTLHVPDKAPPRWQRDDSYRPQRLELDIMEGNLVLF